MKKTTTGIARLGIALIVLALTSVHAFAQTYPNKPLRFIVPTRQAAAPTSSRASSAPSSPKPGASKW